MLIFECSRSYSTPKLCREIEYHALYNIFKGFSPLRYFALISSLTFKKTYTLLFKYHYSYMVNKYVNLREMYFPFQKRTY